MNLVYGLASTRITLYAADGATPLRRMTLQSEQRNGLVLSFKPEGVSHQMGSAAKWARPWAHRGFRASLGIKWDVGEDSQQETWSGSAWGAPEPCLTAIALSLIFTYGFQAPCLVEPHLDVAFSFLAQPDPGKALELRDVRGVAHTGLDLNLIAVEAGSIPDWASL